MTDGVLLAAGCGISFIFLAGTYVYLREGVHWGKPVRQDVGPSEVRPGPSGSAA